MAERDDELGVDGRPVEEAQDEAEVERADAVAALTRHRAYLGREFLTWLLWATNDGEPLIDVDGEPVVAVVVGKVVLRGLAGEATELVVKGHQSAYSELVRVAIDRGLLLHAARFRLQHGERVFELTLDAEFLDVRSATLPAVLGEDDDARLNERLWLCEQAGALVERLWQAFIERRASAAWRAEVVPAMKAWLRD